MCICIMCAGYQLLCSKRPQNTVIRTKMCYHLSVRWVDWTQLGGSHLDVLVGLQSDVGRAEIIGSLNGLHCHVQRTGQHGYNSGGLAEHLSARGLHVASLAATQHDGLKVARSLPQHLFPRGVSHTAEGGGSRALHA